MTIAVCTATSSREEAMAIACASAAAVIPASVRGSIGFRVIGMGNAFGA